MRPMHRNVILAGVTAALVAVPAALAGGQSSKATAPPDRALTLAIIGDIPYGAAQVAAFPAEIAQINADPNVRRVIHLGDIKNGSSRCDSSYFEARLADFDRFEDPVVYTPGDNEWTDCHRANNGGFLPTERLAEIRNVFFKSRGRTLGKRRTVKFQSNFFRENVRWSEAGVTFGTVHVVGSSDNQTPWFGDRTAAGQPAPETRAEKALRTREYVTRQAAALAWIDAIFDDAERRRAPGVVLGMQADMYDGATIDPAYDPIKAVIADRAERFGKPVLLLEGDSHKFLVDKPADMPANVVRVVVQGSAETPHEWLRLRVDPASTQVFSCENVHFTTGTVVPCDAPLAP